MCDYYGKATLSLKNFSWHVDISFLTDRTWRKVFNFNVTDTVVIKYFVVSKCAWDNKIFKFGPDKIC